MPLSELDKLLLEPEIETPYSKLDETLLEEITPEPEKPTWWKTGWGKIKVGYDWLASPEREAELQEIVRETQEGKPLGPVYTQMVRILPGTEDLPDWEEQPLWQKAWTVARFASAVAVGIITTESLAAAYGSTKAYLAARYPRVRTYKEYKWGIDKKTGLLITKKVPKAPPVEKPYPKRFVKPEAKPTPEITLKPSADAAVKKFVRSVPVIEEQVQLSTAKIEAQNMFDKYIRMIDPSISTEASLDASTKITQEITKYLPKVFDPRILETIGREGMKLAALVPDQIKMEVPIISEEPKIPEDLILAMRDTKTSEIITAIPDEKIHTDMMARLGERYKDMEPGWVDSKGKFYDILSGRRTLAGFEPTEEAKVPSPEVAPKAEIPEEKIPEEAIPKKEPEILPEEVKPVPEKEILPEEITPEVKPIKPPIPPIPPPSEPPQFAGEPVEDPIAKLNELIKKAKPLRGKIEKAYTTERAKRITEVEKYIDEMIDTVGGEEGYRMILSKLKGELLPPEAKIAFEPVKEKLTEEQLKALYIRTWKHPYLDNYEKISAAEGLTNLLMGGIPQPKKLVLLEEIYGSKLIKNILSKRVWGIKAKDFLVEAANVPRALLATADMSAFLRQGIIPITAHPVISAKAVGKTFQFAFSPESFEQYFKDLPKDKLYPLMKKSGLSITDPSKATMVEREEVFISRFLQKIPIVKIPVTFAERSYVGFLNKVRVDLFKNWADELLSKGFSPVKDAELFKAAAEVTNTFTGRGSMGALNRVTPELNILFFSPRLITARFNALNPVWYTKQPKEIRQKAISDFGKFVAVGLTTLALIKLAAGDEVDIEIDPRSSDFGKIKIGNTRFDIWGGFQQWARVFAQLVTGERKSTITGEIISLNKEEYPFTTRKEVLLRFIEGKLAPVPGLVNELMSGAKTWTGEEMTAETYSKKVIPMYIQDITEAYADGGLGRAVGAGVPAFFGVGVQTWEIKKKREKYWWR